MRDLSRNANARHQPATAGVDEEFFRDYQVGQRVMTPEGIPGVITEVEDGPFLNMESYEVVLDDGLGGGSYGTHELTAIEGHEASGGGTIAEVVVPQPVDDPNLHLASEDYPELAEILLDRPPLAHAEPLVMHATKTAAVPLVCKDCEQTYFTDGEPHGCTKQALVSEGYYTVEELRALAAPVQADEALFEADPAEIPQEMAPAPTPEIPLEEQEGPFFATAGLWDHILAPLVDKATEHIDAKYPGIETGTVWSYDWCRFRKNRHCFFPKEMDLKATQEAGYAVWVPLDRGICGRDKWDHQKMCPVAEPGPNSGDPNSRLDATVSWQDGGQRGGVWAARNEADHVFEFTAAWSDVRNKAREIRSSGGVRVVSINGDRQTGRVVTAEVRGDSKVYEASIQSEPGRSNVALWTCACPWAAYSWGRSGRWKKYEGRMCSHALALTYEASSKSLAENPDSSWGPDEVQRPGDYVPPPKKASLVHPMRPVALDGYLAVSPAVRIAHSMLAEGQRDQEVVLAFGPQIHATAKVLDFQGRLRALVNGVVKTIAEIITETGRVILTDGTTVSVRDLAYPTYHPTKGLVASLHFEGVNDSGEDDEFAMEYPTTSHGDSGDDPGDSEDLPGDMGSCEVCGRPADWYYGGATRCTTHRVQVAAELLDEPEAALPQTFGDEEDDVDDDDDAGDVADDPAEAPSSVEQEDPADDQSDRTALRGATGSVAAGTTADPLAWLLDGPGGSGGDVAAAASEFLAKQAVKTFSASEQAEIIDEGEGVLAGNLDALDLEGTHYAGLEDVLAAEDEETWLS